jgi:hypothetical protein
LKNKQILKKNTMSSIADNFTEKFLIDVEKFTVWIFDNPTYKISNSDNGDNFNNNSLINLFKDFKEPGRYKMDFFIKHLSKTFPIYKNNNKIELHDIASIVTDFKTNKPKRVPKIFKKSLQSPIISEPILIEPIISEPILIEPIISEPIISEPIISVPILIEPIISEPIISHPIISHPIISEPILIVPIISHPIISEPIISEPIISHPIISEPIISEPIISHPILIEPKTNIINEDEINNMRIKYDFLINKKFIVNLEDIIFDIV